MPDGDGPDGLDRPYLPCDTYGHSECPHAVVRASSSVGLCGCRCHAPCPLASPRSDELDGGDGAETCTCNEARRRRYRRERQSSRPARDGQGSVDLGGVWRQATASARQNRGAREAAAARAAGSSPEVIADIVVEEWRRWGLDPPTGAVLRRTVDWIVDPPGLTERTRVGAALTADLVGLPLRLRRATRGGLGATLERWGASVGPAFTLATGPIDVDVVLGPGAQHPLRRIAARATVLPSFAVTARAEVRVGTSASVEVWADDPGRAGRTDVAAGHGATHIGTVVDGVGDYRAGVDLARSVGQRCVVGAVLVRSRTGAWEMLLGRPLPA